MSNFGKHPDFLVRSASPYNGGPPLGLLREAFVTPNELFFVRNHGNVPRVDPAHYRLSIGGLVKRPRALSLDELRQNFPKRTLTATLQCAGNRREELIEVAPIPDELPWGEEAISNAAWAGAALRDVLGEGPAGIAPEARHVAFAGLDDVQRQGKTLGFGSSIPIEKALSLEVLLAYEMNGEPLPPAHGFPVRAIVPGYIGARSVK
ncbi:MAG: molybdopterin-dependent oxidoreductase, partial [Anaerolineales bacterium]